MKIIWSDVNYRKPRILIDFESLVYGHHHCFSNKVMFFLVLFCCVF